MKSIKSMVGSGSVGGRLWRKPLRVVSLMLLVCMLFGGIVSCSENGTSDGKSAGSKEQVGKSGVKKMFDLSQLDQTDSVGGVDKNNNGIRDDIEEYIESLDLDNEVKSALRFAAYALQQALLVDVNDPVALERVRKLIDHSLSCIDSKFDKEHDRERMKAQDYQKTIEGLTANTKLRTERYIAFNVALSRNVYRLEGGEFCETH